MANPCSLRPHYAHIGSPAGWQRVLLGCVEKETPIPGPAPTDLRTLQIPQAEWNTMRILRIKKGNTEYLPNLPPTLRGLYIHDNNLRELPPLPAGLTDLEINKNQVKSLPPLPASLTHLNVKNNQLTTLPTPIPGSLDDLHVTHNQLTELPSLSDTLLRSVGLGFNQLKELPAFPPTLRKLGFTDNRVSVVKNLPDRLRVLNCSNNPIRVLQIENLIHLDTLIASNCGLTELPLLPTVPHEENNNENGAQYEEDSRDYYFDNNPLSPEFAAIYERYRQANTGWQQHPNPAGGLMIWSRRTPGSTKQFREAILAEHKRLIALKKTQLGELIRMKRAPAAALGPTLERLAGNHGPLNLISQFITGRPGTLEAQRLALLQNQERLGAVPPGTTADAINRIENIIANPNRPAMNRERAALYLPRDRIQAAKAEYEAEVARRLELLRIEEEKKQAMRSLTKLLLWMGVLQSEAHLKYQKLELDLQNEPSFDSEERIIQDLLNKFRSDYTLDLKITLSEKKDLLKALHEKLQDPTHKPYIVAGLQRAMLSLAFFLMKDIEENVTSENFKQMIETYPQLFKPADIQHLKEFITECVESLPNVLAKDPLDMETFDTIMNEFLAAIVDIHDTDTPEEEANPEVDAALNGIREAGNNFVAVVEDDEAESEADRAIAAEMGALVNVNGNGNNNSINNSNQDGGKRKTRRNKKKTSRQTRRR